MEGSGSASGELQPANCTNLTTCDEDDESIDLARTGTLVIIMTLSLIGNIFTIIVVSKFKVRRIPDVLVIGLACTDLVATLIPVPMTLYSYVTLENYHDLTCAFYATVAHFTRYSSLLIVTTVAVERYYAINRPFFYRNHATPKKFVVILIGCWAISFIYAVFPAVHPDTEIDEYDGFCLFDISSRYAISILVYAGIQYVIVFVCFVMVMVELLQVYRRRKQLKVRDDYNRRSRAAGTRDNPRFQRPPSLTTRISDLGKSLARAAPVITEKFQLGVEAQFARMLLCVVLLFYVSWTPMVVLIVLGVLKGSNGGLETGVFWAIRLSVISTAINPFLYGLLARQYRLAYAYLFRLWLNKFCCCCTCIDPPLKDVFASARGEARQPSHYDRNSRRDTMELRRQDSSQQNGSGDQRSRGVPVLTRTTAHKDVALPEYDRFNSGVFLTTIQEESTTDHAEFAPTADGSPLPSSLPPHHGQDSSHLGQHVKPRSRSVDQITHVDFLHELGPSGLPHAGSHNPLAYIADIEGERAVAGSPVLSEQSRELNLAEGPGKVLFAPNQKAESRSPRSISPLVPPQQQQKEALLPRKEPLRVVRSFPLSMEVIPASAVSQQVPEERASVERSTEGLSAENLKGKKAASTAVLTSEEVDRAFEAVDGIVRDVVLEARSLHPSEAEARPVQPGSERGRGPTKSSTCVSNNISVAAAVREFRAKKSSHNQNRHSFPELHSSDQLAAYDRLTSLPPIGANSRHQQTARKLSPPFHGPGTADSGFRRARFETTPPTSPNYPVQTARTSRRHSTDNSDSGRESMTFDPEVAATTIDMDSVL